MYQKNLLYSTKLFWSNLLPYFITTTEEVLSISRLNTLAKNLKFRRGNRNVLIETYLGKIEKGEEEPTSFEIIRHQYQIPKERKDILFLHNSLRLHIYCPGFNLFQNLTNQLSLFESSFIQRLICLAMYFVMFVAIRLPTEMILNEWFSKALQGLKLTVWQ